MRTVSQLLLTFLLNAVWQVALIGALASFGAWLLRQSARYQHWLWVAALCLSLVVPVTAVRALPGPTSSQVRYGRELENPVVVSDVPDRVTTASLSNSAFHLNSSLALVLLSAFAAFVLYRAFRLIRAWFITRRVRLAAVRSDRDEAVEAILRECAKRLNIKTKSIAV